jgi:uncharacterized protein (TIGR02996 family)
MTTEDDFQRALAAKPRDWQTRLVFADWLQERGDPRAEGYRVQGLRQRAPEYFKGAKAWVWLNPHWAATYPATDTIRAATLPDDWYKLLPVHNSEGAECAEERPTLRESMDDAALAFARLPPARRAELLAQGGPLDVPLPPKTDKSGSKRPNKRSRPTDE